MKRVDGELESSLLPRWKRVRGAVVSFFPRFLVGVIIFAFMPRPVLAEPQGPSIPAGQATIQGLPGNLNITQLTDKLIINWQSFNIGRGETVRFLQPNALAIALNRVTGLDPSVIEGALRANGRLFLVNPNGIVFGNNASVNVGSLMATTLQISDKDFLDGNYRFTQEISKNLAFVVNKGNITAADGGFIVLMAPLVVNEGVLVANLGKISLNATGEAEISLDEGGLVRVAVPGRTTAAGDVVVSSALTQDVLCSVIRSPGLDKATAMVQEDGVTRLTAGEGIVLNAGTVSANGASGGSVTIQGTQHAMVENGTVEARGETGGEVRILAQDRVGLLGNTTVDASGQTGGGNILIGGDYLGGGGVLTARATFVCSEAAIKACAGTVGEGGRIIVWSDESTRTYGAISARGGSCGGRGGFVETSGGYLDVRGTPDISGINGEGGTWLLDPNFIQIVAGSTTNISNCQPCTFFGSTCGCSFLNVCQLVAAFTGGANVRVKTTEADNGSIALLADLNYSTAPGTNTLSLESTGNICIKAKITGGPCRVLNLKLDNCWTGSGTPGDTCISGAVIDTGGGNFDSSGNNFTLGNCSVLNTKNGAVVLKQKGTIVLGCNINACTAAVSMTATSISGTGQVQSGTLSAVHEGAPGNFNLNTKTGSASISGGFNNIALNNTGGQLTIFKANAAGACSTVSITNNCGMNIAFGCGTTISADTVTITENGTSTNGIGVCSGSVIFPTIDATKTVTITNNSANSDVTLQNNAIRVTGGTVNVNSARDILSGAVGAPKINTGTVNLLATRKIGFACNELALSAVTLNATTTGGCGLIFVDGLGCTALTNITLSVADTQVHLERDGICLLNFNQVGTNFKVGETTNLAVTNTAGGIRVLGAVVCGNLSLTATNGAIQVDGACAPTPIINAGGTLTLTQNGTNGCFRICGPSTPTAGSTIQAGTVILAGNGAGGALRIFGPSGSATSPTITANSVNVSTTNPCALPDVVLGGKAIAAGTTVTINAKGSILAPGVSIESISAPSISLSSAQETIGTACDPLEILTAGLSATAKGVVNLEARAGGLFCCRLGVNALRSTCGNVFLHSGVDVTVAGALGSIETVRGANVTLIQTGADADDLIIGGPGFGATVSTVRATAGNVEIHNTSAASGSDLKVSPPSVAQPTISATGDVLLFAVCCSDPVGSHSLCLNTNVVFAGGAFTAVARTSIIDSTPLSGFADVTATAVTLNANTGGITLDTATASLSANAGTAIQIREAGVGNLSIGTVKAPTSISIQTAGGLVDGNADCVNLTSGSATLASVGGVDLDVALGSISVTATSGAVTLGVSGSLTISQILAGATAINVCSSGALTLNGNLTSGGPVSLSTTSCGINQTSGALTSDSLRLLGAGNFTLNGPCNDVNLLAACVNGMLALTDKDGLTIGTIGPTVGINTGGPSLNIKACGLVSVSSAITTGTGGVLIDTTGDLVFNAGGISTVGGTTRLRAAAIRDTNAALDVTANLLQMKAPCGDIGGCGNPLETAVSALQVPDCGCLPGAVNLSISNSGAGITLQNVRVANVATINASGNVIVDNVTAGAATFNVTGSILKGSGPGITATCGVTLTSNTGTIGTCTAALLVSTPNLTTNALGCAQGTWITDGTALASGNLRTDGGIIDITYASGGLISLNGCGGLISLNGCGVLNVCRGGANPNLTVLNEAGPGNTVKLGLVDVGSGALTVHASGAITDNNGAASNNLIASTATLIADAGAIEADVTVNTIRAHADANCAGVTIRANGTLNVGDVTAVGNSGDVSITGNATLNVQNVAAGNVVVPGTVLLHATSGNVTLLENTSATPTVTAPSGAVTVRTDNGNILDTSGLTALCATSATLQASNGDIGTSANPLDTNLSQLTAKALSLNNVIKVQNAGTGLTTLSVVTTDGDVAVALGCGQNLTFLAASDTLGLNANATNPTFSFDNKCGGLALELVDVGTGTVTLDAAGNISDTNGPGNNLAGNSASLKTTGTINLDTTVSQITTVSGGNTTLRSTGPLQINGLQAGGTGTTVNTAGLLTLNGNVTSAGTLAIFSAGVTQSAGKLQATCMSVTGSGAFTLNAACNDVNGLAFCVNGAFNFGDKDDLTIGCVCCTGASASKGSAITLQTGGLLRLDKDLNAGPAAVTLTSGCNVQFGNGGTKGGVFGGCVTVTGQSLVDGNGAVIDVTACTANLRATAGDVGAAGASLDLAVSTLKVKNGACIGATNVYVNDSNAITLADVRASGTVDVLAPGSITVQTVNAGDATLTSQSGSILQSGAAGVSAPTVVLTATAGTIGTCGTPLVTNALSLSTVTLGASQTTTVNNGGALTNLSVRTNGAVNILFTGGNLTFTGASLLDVNAGSNPSVTFLNEVVPGRNINVNQINIGTGALTLHASGAILDNNGVGTPNVTAGSATLTADNGGISLDTAISGLTANASAGGQSVNLRNSGALNVGAVAAGCNVTLSTAGGNLTVGTVTAGNTASLTAGSGILDGNSSALNVSAPTGIFTANGGGVDIDVDVCNLTVNANGGTIAVDEANCLLAVNVATANKAINLNWCNSGTRFLNFAAGALSMIGAGTEVQFSNSAGGYQLGNGSTGVSVGACNGLALLATGNVTWDGVTTTRAQCLTFNVGGFDLGTLGMPLAIDAVNLQVMNGVACGIPQAGAGRVFVNDANSVNLNNVAASINANVRSQACMTTSGFGVLAPTITLTSVGGSINATTRGGTIIANASNMLTLCEFDKALLQCLSSACLTVSNTSGDLTVGTVLAGGTATLTAAGSLLDGNGACSNLSATAATLTASGGSIALDTLLGTVTASATAGSVTVHDGDALTVSSIIAFDDVTVSLDAGSLTVGAISAGDTVTLTAAGGVLDGNGACANNVLGNSGAFTAGSGSINLDTSLVTLTATASGQDVVIRELNALTVSGASATRDVTITSACGDLTLSGVSAGRDVTAAASKGTLKVGTVTAVCDAALSGLKGVSDSNGSGTLNVTASVLTVGSGVGGVSLDTLLGTVTASAGGDLSVRNGDGLTVTSATAGGNLTILSNNGSLAIGTVTAGGCAALGAALGIIDNNGSGVVNVTAATGNFIALCGNLELDTALGGVSTCVPNGGVALREADGLTLTSVIAGGNVAVSNASGNLVVKAVNAGGTAGLSAACDLLGSGTVTAPQAVLRAGGDIGACGTPLGTCTNVLDVAANGMFVSDAGSLTTLRLVALDADFLVKWSGGSLQRGGGVLSGTGAGADLELTNSGSAAFSMGSMNFAGSCVTLSGTPSWLDGNGTGTLNLTACTLNIAGSASTVVDLDTNIATLNANGACRVTLRQASTITLDTVVNVGSLHVGASGCILVDQVQFTAAQTLVLTATGAILDINGAGVLNVSGPTLVLTAGGAIDLDTSACTITADGASVTLCEANGAILQSIVADGLVSIISASGNLLLVGVIAGDSVTLQTVGNILGQPGSPLHLRAGDSSTLSALGGGVVGTSTNPLVVDVIGTLNVLATGTVNGVSVGITGSVVPGGIVYLAPPPGQIFVTGVTTGDCAGGNSVEQQVAALVALIANTGTSATLTTLVEIDDVSGDGNPCIVVAECGPSGGECGSTPGGCASTPGGETATGGCETPANEDGSATKTRTEETEEAGSEIALIEDTGAKLAQATAALEHVTQALEAARASGDQVGVIEASTELPELLMQVKPEGWAEQAQGHIDTALNLSKSIDFKPGEITALANLGKLQAATGNTDGALSSLESSLGILESYAQSVGGAGLRSAKLTDRTAGIYQNLASLQISNGNAQAALQTLERQHSMAVVENLGAGLDRINVTNPGLKGLLRSASGNQKNTQDLEKELTEQKSLPADKQDHTRIKVVSELLAANKEEFEKTLEALRKTEPGYEKLLAVRPVHFAEMQKSVPGNTAVFEYMITDEKLYVFSMTQTNFRIHAVDVKRAEVEGLVKRYRSLVMRFATLRASGTTIPWNNDGSAQYTRYIKPLKETMTRLHAILIDPIEADVKDKQVVSVIPTGILMYLPFQSLGRLRADGEMDYLIERKQLSVMTKASELVGLASAPPSARGNLVAFGNPDGSLAEAQNEVRNLAALFQGATVYMRDEATKNQILSLPPGVSYVHLATHGILNSEDPTTSYLVMAGAGQEGKLLVTDIFSLPLAGIRLITLSACETALAEKRPGAELTSLAEAFSIAGAPSVVASLWKVDDVATRAWMLSFYRQLKDGRSKSQAMQQAVVSTLRASGFEHPFYWAPFVVLGDWR